MSEFLASVAAKAAVLLLEALIVRALQALFAPAPAPATT
jgi:hypothetical protein